MPPSHPNSPRSAPTRITDARCLIVGAHGMVGRAWQALLQREGVPYAALGTATLDITDPEAVERTLQPGLEAVINCAAFTDVDGAEQHEDQATRVNGVAPGYLATRCQAIGATLVHLSTDYVFDGQATAPYPVDAPYAPLNAYGRSKAEGERRIVASGCAHLILRTSWVYAPWAKNFVTTIARLVRERDTLRVVNDQRGRPTSAEHLAESSLRLLRQNATGILHVTDGGECTWYELACAIAGHLDSCCRVEPCPTSELPRPAARPAYSVLDLAPTERVIGPMPAWQQNLAAVLSRLQCC